jgi:hypothetical protein
MMCPQIELRTTMVQDAPFFIEAYPEHPMWKIYPFNDPDYREWGRQHMVKCRDARNMPPDVLMNKMAMSGNETACQLLAHTQSNVEQIKSDLLGVKLGFAKATERLEEWAQAQTAMMEKQWAKNEAWMETMQDTWLQFVRGMNASQRNNNAVFAATAGSPASSWACHGNSQDVAGSTDVHGVVDTNALSGDGTRETAQRRNKRQKLLVPAVYSNNLGPIATTGTTTPALYEGMLRELSADEMPSWNTFRGSKAVQLFVQWFCWGRPGRSPAGQPPPRDIIAWTNNRSFCPGRTGRQKTNAMMHLWDVILMKASAHGGSGTLAERLNRAAIDCDVERGRYSIPTWMTGVAFKEKYRGVVVPTPNPHSYATAVQST